MKVFVYYYLLMVLCCDWEQHAHLTRPCRHSPAAELHALMYLDGQCLIHTTATCGAAVSRFVL